MTIPQTVMARIDYHYGALKIYNQEKEKTNRTKDDTQIQNR